MLVINIDFTSFETLFLSCFHFNRTRKHHFHMKLTSPKDSGNKVSRRANISGTANITLGGKTVIMADVHLRGDLTRTKSPDPKIASAKPQAITSISIGKQTIVATGSVIKPPGRISRGMWTYYPMKIGDNVFIGEFLCTTKTRSNFLIGIRLADENWCRT